MNIGQHDSRHELGLEVKALTKAFGEHYALIELNATWNKGEICALLGPNGAGKSTLLNLLSTLSAASEGTIIMNGVELTPERSTELREQIAFVGHTTMIYGSLTAFENLEFFANLYQCWPSGLNKSSQEAWLLEQLALVGLEYAAHRLASGFSRGMSQRLTIARALLPAPKLILLDEPFTGLDQAGIELVSALILKARQSGATVILSSHDLESTQKLCDRALILKGGRLQQIYDLKQADTPALSELYRRSIGT